MDKAAIYKAHIKGELLKDISKAILSGNHLCIEENAELIGNLLVSSDEVYISSISSRTHYLLKEKDHSFLIGVGQRVCIQMPKLYESISSNLKKE